MVVLGPYRSFEFSLLEKNVRFNHGSRIMYLRLQDQPTADPHAIGKRMEAAGFANIAAGSVMDGINVVMLATRVLWLV